MEISDEYKNIVGLPIELVKFISLLMSVETNRHKTVNLAYLLPNISIQLVSIFSLQQLDR